MPFEMNICWALILFMGGLYILLRAANTVVSGSVAVAKHFGVSNLVVGMTIVAMGTSSPEVAASIAAAIGGNGDVAIGNVYGSNIANLALVGGICVLLRPIEMRGLSKVKKREMPVMLIVGLLLLPILWNMRLGRLEGISLLVLFTALIVLTVHFARKEKHSVGPVGKNDMSLTKGSVLTIVGLIGLAIGAKLTLWGAIYIGETIGLSKAVIGLTIIAIGTSLPELITCVVATLRGEDELSIGNLVGSNIFNTLLVVGCAGTIRPFTISSRLIGIDYGVFIFITALFIILASFGKRITRRKGGILLGCYVLYMIYLLAFTAGK